MYGNEDGTVPATFQILNMIAWKPDPSQVSLLPSNTSEKTTTSTSLDSKHWHQYSVATHLESREIREIISDERVREIHEKQSKLGKSEIVLSNVL